MLKELANFSFINVGVSLIFRLAQATWPEVFVSFALAMAVASGILVANLYRAYASAPFRRIYAAISVLNVITVVLASNTSFLTSLGSYFRAFSSFIGSS